MLALGAGAALGVGAAAPAPPGLATRDEPPPGFSGGFGEAACDACHFEAEPNLKPGRLSLAGTPERYVPAEAYRLTVTLTRPAMAIGGFQLTARFEEGGAQAGSLEPAPGEEGRVGVTSSFDVRYAHHLRPGTELVAPDTARWSLVWTAPPQGGAVLFHVAANAADGDDSQFGDYVYTTVEASGPQAP